VEFIIDPTRMWGEHSKYQKEGIEPVHYRQQTLTMSQPMKDLEALAKSGKIIHNGDPILAWAIGNTVAEPDKKDNVYPNKENVENKIDPTIGTLFCLGRAMTRDPEPSGPMFDF
jgi:phage terminase large subunit-like protein